MHTHTPQVRRRARRRSTRWLASAAALLAMIGIAGPIQSSASAAGTAPEIATGTLADGTPYRIEVPADWNGTVALYSHGLVFPGDENPVRAAFDDSFGRYLLDQGVALAGSAFPTGWAVEEALVDQRATLDELAARFGQPAEVIAYGDSLGGMISTALAESFPGRIDGALAMCGVEAGAVGGWNHFLDSAFVFKTLLAPTGELRVTGITDPLANLQAASQVFDASLGSAKGRARLALVAAVAQLPGGIDPSGPSSLATPGQRFEARMAWLQAPYLPITFAERGEMEARAGGNPSWNTGVDYAQLLKTSQQRDDVRAMYKQAGLNLESDLKALAKAPRVHPDGAAVRFLESNVSFSGDLERPVFTIRNVSDGALPSSHDRAYAEAVAGRGRSEFLRQSFVDRPGHCTFTTAESVIAFETVRHRLDTGSWLDTSSASLNAEAAALGPDLNQGGGFPVPPAFVTHHPLAFPRSFVVQ
jgi:pimeloyl-ACP methyl ester carboxylesterase